jgi:hypothetical protein
VKICELRVPASGTTCGYEPWPLTARSQCSLRQVADVYLKMLKFAANRVTVLFCLNWLDLWRLQAEDISRWAGGKYSHIYRVIIK